MSARVILVGGGLANGLIAYRLRMLRPEIDVTLLERGDRIGGHHVWCFHDGDLSAAQHDWMAPFVMQSWHSHEVHFPKRRRRIHTGYHAITSDHFHDLLTRLLGERARTRVHVEEVRPRAVRLAGGEVLEGEAVIDGRGDPGGGSLALGYQKFLGQWLELESRHHMDGPMLMDATVDQLDGFRFMYTLPFGDRLLHIEDTRYSDAVEIDRDSLRAEIRAYAEERGWLIRRVHREEEGVLPIVLGGDIEAFWRERTPDVPCSGIRAALFHPTTGYSLPEAVRLADAIAEAPELDSHALYLLTKQRSVNLWRSTGYFRLLNRMLFRAAEPDQRYVIMQQFYGRSDDLIGRFYAGRLTAVDRLQILSGKPPVPLVRAMKCLFDDGATAA